jgi:NhaP-type Na+/H+ and K+/H+ antiporter
MIELLVVAVLAFVAGMKISTALNTLAFRKVLEQLGVKQSDLRKLAEREGLEVPEQDPEATPQLTQVEIKIEQHGGTLYAYRLDNDQFLGQGTDRDSLIASLTNNLTNVRVVVDKDNGADFIK